MKLKKWIYTDVVISMSSANKWKKNLHLFLPKQLIFTKNSRNFTRPTIKANGNISADSLPIFPSDIRDGRNR